MSTLPNVTPVDSSLDQSCNAEKCIVSSGNDNEGVSTNYTHTATDSLDKKSHWYAIRTTYGREEKGYKSCIEKNFKAFYPTISVDKVIKGKHKRVLQSCIPNVFFVYGTEEDVKGVVYDNVNFPYLRFYYTQYHDRFNIVKIPLVIPDCQMRSFMLLCETRSKDIKIVPETVKNFEKGELVKVIEGQFEGVIGRVARWQGQQRVGIIIENFITISTAYIPSSFLEKIEDTEIQKEFDHSI